MYRKYYSYNDMPKPVKPPPPGGGRRPDAPPPKGWEISCAPPKEIKKDQLPGGILAGFERDDLILAAILLVLLIDGCNDKLLLAAIGFLLVEGL